MDLLGVRSSLFAILALLAFLCLSACPIHAEIKGDDKPLIVITISPLYLIAKEIIGNNTEIYVLAPAGVDPHLYSPTPEHAMKVASCNLFICVGKEEFLGQLQGHIEELRARGGLIINWDSWIKEGVHVEDDNPHYLWLYPPNAKIIAKVVAKAMSLLDPNNRDYYFLRANIFEGKINELEEWRDSVMENFKEVRVLLAGDHFEPFVKWLGLSISSIIIKGEGGLPGPQKIKEAVNAARTSKLIVVSALQVEGYEGAYASQVSAESGIPIACLYGVPLSMSDTYVEFIKYNSMILTSHLTHDQPISRLAMPLMSEVYIALIILLASIAVIEGIIILRLRLR